MREADQITRVEIDGEGRLHISPSRMEFSHIYRAAMEIDWDQASRTLHSPGRPRVQEWDMTYPKWFAQIVAAAADEYGVRLSLSSEVKWLNVPAEIRGEIERLPT